MQTLTIAGLESVYEQLAEALDRAPQAQRELFLVKLVLLAAEALGEPERFAELTEAALLDL